MDNIIPYLWQSSETNNKSDNTIRIVDTIIKTDQHLHWYFFSAKQNKILRKKKQNTNPSSIMEDFQKKQNHKFQGLYIGVMWTFNPFNKRIISASQLVENIYDTNKTFTFYNLMGLKDPKLYVLDYQDGKMNIQPFSSSFQVSTEIQIKVKQFFKVLEQMISNATIKKSEKILKAELLVGYSQKRVYLICVDAFVVENDYYHISYEHKVEEIEKTEQISGNLMDCEGCSEKRESKQMKEVNYQGIVRIKTYKKKSKYGLNAMRLYTICAKCYQILSLEAQQ